MIIEHSRSTDDAKGWPISPPNRVSMALLVLAIGYVGLFFCLGYLWAVLT